MRCAAASSDLTLSVSSVGSWALQLSIVPAIRRTADAFQYPRSDRGHCNRTALQLAIASLQAFQYPRSDRGHCNHADELCNREIDSAFQYPRSDRGHCNSMRLDRTPASVIRFQYPRSDRGHCNSCRRSISCSQRLHFQYPRSDRGHCNTRRRSCRHVPSADLSVSSVGSWALQLSRASDCTSRGSDVFQYPRSDRGHCNLAARPRRSRRTCRFQYPRSDRGHCNSLSLSLIAHRISHHRVSLISSSPTATPAPQNHPAWGRRPHDDQPLTLTPDN